MDVAFTLGGRPMRLTRAEVEKSVAGVDPEPLRAHAVEIGGRLFPPKQPFALATGLDRLDFTTNQARTQLLRLGFHVERIEGT